MPSNMLPLPSSTSKRNRTYFPSLPTNHNLSSSQQVLQTLRSRTRLTNLAVFLLLLCLSSSLILNLNYLLLSSSSTFRPSSSTYRTTSSKGWDDLITPSQLRSGIPLSIETTIERDPRYSELNHLIMVPGHAIWLGHDADKVNENDDWILEPMQKGGSVRTYVKHIQRGVEELKRDNNALLIFSGGATRLPPSPPLPEAISYHNLAHALDLLPSTPISPSDGESKAPLSLNLRAATEEYALDSYENLLFSIARFKEVTDRYPERITVVGYGMKERRFTNLHRSALAFPLQNFTYIGINDDLPDLSKHYAGELKFGFKPFLNSPTGCHPPLSTKKLLRNPYIKYHPYHTSNPELLELFEWCPPLQSHRERDSLDEYEGVYGMSFGGWVPWNAGRMEGDEVTWGRERD
ncbi:hypothetical protein I302_100719 [Kwoniella bestiolae CBS 10118]|uniref:Cytoplasmic protein n=1 Tax=Kwoniella bestiolae CBS 10118 TaxID=1296100 RepID=A0A1B9G5X6_9TREE|nr:cytoplasmic protein [Kwoniella bestiolae CBS 10118]OCF26410.1 cytoplasmic protein [Kwoniella bestiolae CBS 10118]